MSDFTLDWFGNKIKRDVKNGFELAVEQSANDLSQRSADEAPIDLGDLRGNAGIDDSNLKSEGFVFVGYGLPYALVQHESLDYDHPKGGKAKYLEDPFLANAANYERHIARNVDKATT